MPVEKNKLYYGDNLAVLFAEKQGSRSASQITAFKDTWEWNIEAERSYEEDIV